MLLTDKELLDQLKDLDGWDINGKTIQKEIVKGHWREVISLANAISDIAEASCHHPELYLSFTKIKVSLTTHDAGGISNKDTAMAEKINQLL